MQFLAAAILGAFIQGASTLVGRILIALGFGYVSYTGISTALDYAESQVISNLQGLPSVAVQIASATKVDVAVSIIFSAIAVRLLLQGLTGGAFKRLVMK